MERFNRYLSDAWAISQAHYANKKTLTLNVTLGNVSGDVDSVACAIVLGFYLSHKDGFYDEEEKGDFDAENLSEERLAKFHVPMLNMLQKELNARSDIVHHFENSGVDKDKIPALNNIDLQYYASEGRLSVSLVDHNVPDCTQEFLTPHVVRILDHHQEKVVEYPRMEYKDIRFCGSAATLVAKLMLEDELWREKLLDKDVVFFCSAPILMDTANFKEKLRGKKWDQIDEDIYKTLMEIAGDRIPEDYFETLYHKKTDIQTNLNLGWHLLARKDYKNFQINELRLGISTVFLDLDVCEREFGPERMREEFEDILQEKDLHMYVVLTDYEHEGETRRQVLSYSNDDVLAHRLKDLFDNVKEINLEPIHVGKLTEIENCWTWQNHSLDYSRKKFEPFIRAYFNH